MTTSIQVFKKHHLSQPIGKCLSLYVHFYIYPFIHNMYICEGDTWPRTPLPNSPFPQIMFPHTLQLPSTLSSRHLGRKLPVASIRILPSIPPPAPAYSLFSSAHPPSWVCHESPWNLPSNGKTFPGGWEGRGKASRQHHNVPTFINYAPSCGYLRPSSCSWSFQ